MYHSNLLFLQNFLKYVTFNSYKNFSKLCPISRTIGRDYFVRFKNIKTQYQTVNLSIMDWSQMVTHPWTKLFSLQNLEKYHPYEININFIGWVVTGLTGINSIHVDGKFQIKGDFKSLSKENNCISDDYLVSVEGTFQDGLLAGLYYWNITPIENSDDSLQFVMDQVNTIQKTDTYCTYYNKGVISDVDVYIREDCIQIHRYQKDKIRDSSYFSYPLLRQNYMNLSFASWDERKATIEKLLCETERPKFHDK